MKKFRVGDLFWFPHGSRGHYVVTKDSEHGTPTAQYFDHRGNIIKLEITNISGIELYSESMSE